MRKSISRFLIASAVFAQPLCAHASSRYDFNGGFGDTTGAGPNLSPLGGKLNAGFYEFAPNQGLTLAWSGFDRATYDITIRFSFTTVGANAGYRKILDFDGRTTDEDLYVFNEHLEFVETTAARGVEKLIDGPAGTFSPNQLVELHLIRDGASQLFSASLNNVAQFSFKDVNGRAIFSGANPIATFFADDTVTNQTEASAGRVDFIAVSAVPLPMTLPLMAFGLGVLSWRRLWNV